jgi:hypothetical protein
MVGCRLGYGDSSGVVALQNLDTFMVPFLPRSLSLPLSLSLSLSPA